MKGNSPFIKQEIRLEVLPGADVAVAGGGPAGVAAALAAARQGARTVLIERYGFLGGMATAGNAGLTMFTRYSGDPRRRDRDEARLETSPGEVQVVGGIAAEIARRLLDSGCARGTRGTFAAYVFTSSEDFKRLLLRMMSQAGVEMRLHSTAADVINEAGRIKGIVIESKSGRQFIPARTVVDATGDGDVAFRAGAPFTVGVTRQDLCYENGREGECTPAGVMFRAGSVDLARTFSWLEENPGEYQEHPFSRLRLKSARRSFENGDAAAILIRHGDIGKIQVYNLPAPGAVTLCCPSVGNIDGCRAEDLTRAEILMAEIVGRWAGKIKSDIPGFENMYIMDCPQIGVRESRHIEGHYILRLEDIYEQKHFEDCIGFGSHPVDTTPRPDWLLDPADSYPPGWYFEIPYRCLTVKNTGNLLAAGRCISATHEAFGCIRTTAQCMVTGEAAGTAAALCGAGGVSPASLDTELLRSTLKKNGVLL